MALPRFLDECIQVCSFSFSGATVQALKENIDGLPLKKFNFAVVYAGGNNLQNGDWGPASVKEEELTTPQHGCKLWRKMC